MLVLFWPNIVEVTEWHLIKCIIVNIMHAHIRWYNPCIGTFCTNSFDSSHTLLLYCLLFTMYIFSSVMHIDFVTGTPCIYFSLFSLHCWEGPVSKHFTVSLHLLFTKHVTNSIWFDIHQSSPLRLWLHLQMNYLLLFNFTVSWSCEQKCSKFNDKYEWLLMGYNAKKYINVFLYYGKLGIGQIHVSKTVTNEVLFVVSQRHLVVNIINGSAITA